MIESLIDLLRSPVFRDVDYSLQFLDVGGHHSLELIGIIFFLDAPSGLLDHVLLASRALVEFLMLCDLLHTHPRMVRPHDDLSRHLHSSHFGHSAIGPAHLDVTQHIGDGVPGSGLDILGHLHHLVVPQLLWHHQDFGGFCAPG